MLCNQLGDFIVLDPHSSNFVDPDPDPDPHTINAYPHNWIKRNYYLTRPLDNFF